MGMGENRKDFPYLRYIVGERRGVLTQSVPFGDVSMPYVDTFYGFMSIC